MMGFCTFNTVELGQRNVY